jgi:trehalose utilization protein
VLEGMGIIVLHSAHASKVFSRLMGTRTQSLRWREADEKQRYWIVAPHHPITWGLKGEYFEIPMDETYAEYFEIPQPDEQIFITSTGGGEVFRSGNCWFRGAGRIFYFQGGHETYPVYYQREVQLIIKNAVRWAATGRRDNWPNWAREAKPLI